MKKVLKVFGIVVSSIIVIIVVAVTVYSWAKSKKAKDIYATLGEEAPILTLDGTTFRDLNKNARMDVYEDAKADIEDRVSDLLNQMTVEEKAGTMFITVIGSTSKGGLFDRPRISGNPIEIMLAFFPSTSEMLVNKKMNSFNILTSNDADIMARFNNNIQKAAERMRLGIPVTIATDPRHSSENNLGAALFTSAFSHWPNQLGLAATRDTILVREFGDIARQEYRAIGITVALHPMADLSTEPRWARTNGTFGEDADVSAMMTKAYVLGFQGDSLDSEGVACMTKHFSGGGPQMDGYDAHFEYGKDQAYPGDNFDYHLIPFIEGAFPANTAQIMPYYGIPIGQTNEDVAFAFNKDIITGLLRDSLKFDGVVCTDWSIISPNILGKARAWGVLDLPPILRVKKVIHAGCDQFGGETVPELVVELVESGQISEARIDQSVRRILRDKFRLGLFDNPYVDEAKALEVVGNEKFVQKGIEAQAKSVVLLKNNNLLPLVEGIKIFTEGLVNPEALEKYGKLVKDPVKADLIILRLATPCSPPRGKGLLEKIFHQGRLFYSAEELGEILGLIEQKPTLVVVHLERPAILTEINDKCTALMVEFGTSDEVLAEVIFGKKSPQGKLPFELPLNAEAVKKQLEDVPYDSEYPLYEFGYGLFYK